MALLDTALATLTEAKSYLKIDTAASETVYAEYVGEGDGSDKTFDLDNTPIGGSLRLYVDGTLQVETTDYSISGVTITFVTAPASPKPITANYEKAASDDTFEAYDDDLLEQMINAATRIVENYCGRAFITRAVTENRIGNGDTLIRLYWQPVDDLTSVTLDDELLTAVTEYTDLAYKGMVKRTSKWTKDKTLVIVYDAGDCANLAAVKTNYPEAIEACLLLLADLYENRSDTTDTEHITGIGITSYKLPSRAEKILSALSLTGGMT